MQRILLPESFGKVGIIADLHFPFQSDSHIDRAKNDLLREKPDCIVVDGDLVDFFEISKYNTNPSLDFLVENQVPMARDFLFELRRDHPLAKIILVEGNHEFRVRSYLINNARAVYKFLRQEILPEDILPTALKLNEFNIEWVGTNPNAARWTDTYFSFQGVDDLRIGHFDKVANPTIPAGMTVRQLMMKGGGSYVQAHVHRAGLIFNTDIQGRISWGMETPCLASDPHYRSFVNWQRGVSFLEKDGKGRWNPRLVVYD